MKCSIKSLKFSFALKRKIQIGKHVTNRKFNFFLLIKI